MREFLRNFFSGSSDEEIISPVDIKDAIRKSITVHGRVQGVGFRYFVQQEARHLRLTGWVKNLNDGSVTMEVQGSPTDVEELISRLKKGNGYSKVVQMKSSDLAVVADENKFRVTY